MSRMTWEAWTVGFPTPALKRGGRAEYAGGYVVRHRSGPDACYCSTFCCMEAFRRAIEHTPWSLRDEPVPAFDPDAEFDDLPTGAVQLFQPCRIRRKL